MSVARDASKFLDNASRERQQRLDAHASRTCKHQRADDDALRLRRRDERLLKRALAASVALHIVFILVVPGDRHAQRTEPPPLQVAIVKAPVPQPMSTEPPRIKPPPPPAMARTPLPRAQPKASIARETPPAPRKQVLALPETAQSPVPVPTALPTQPSEAPPSAAPPAPPAASSEPKVVAAAPAAGASAARDAAPATPPVYNAAYLGNAPPRYPMIARRNGVEGTAYVQVVVSKEGRALDVQLHKSSGSPPIDSAALEAAKRWKFAPARRGQEPVEQSVVVPFVFKLEGSS